MDKTLKEQTEIKTSSDYRATSNALRYNTGDYSKAQRMAMRDAMIQAQWDAAGE